MPPHPSSRADPRAELDVAIAELHEATAGYVATARRRAVGQNGPRAKRGGRNDGTIGDSPQVNGEQQQNKRRPDVERKPASGRPTLLRWLVAKIVGLCRRLRGH